ncbi:hypothetical protein HJC23_009021 [Cyclotella cryptica]|uniref:Uncharacterized protein n=1 Tax=Cyclotella cryptica TaxID=29204 RepID=A0ABD3QY04_9STRA|eukprot:CCRYP_000625-RA/>CCRYP_000625-RA protein AED:0.02 eAED:0.02 QI:849/1/1/1/1/1/2/206/951
MNQRVYTRSSLSQPTSITQTATEEARRKVQHFKRISRRVAPTRPEAVDNEAGVIDDEILERCTRCPPHRRRRGKFRPLIGNDGEFLCDSCYLAEFPATAFLDEAEKPEWQKRGNKIANKIKNGVTDFLADAMGAAEVASFGNRSISEDTKFPSEVECRMCLEKGVFRRCCTAYYCHSCYYKSGKCPGCGKDSPLTGIGTGKDHPGNLAIGLSWAISLAMICATITLLALIYWNVVTSPVTVWGHTCRGFFPTCELTVCIDYDGGNGYGVGGSWIPAAQPYRVCDRASTSNQVVGSACVYDNELYVWSNKVMGYDICMSSPREEKTRSKNVSSVNPLLLYTESSGVYVFDDDFELPSRPKSAPWREIINGNFSDLCGVNSVSPERGNHGGFRPVENKHALVFSGVHARYAVTSGLNVEYGGTVEFYLKMGPLDDLDTECKTAYSGDVALEYCLHPDECIPFGFFPAWKYRGSAFQFISIAIPHDAWSNSTSFCFRQESFDDMQDYWAIDDVRIHANLQSRWLESSAFAQRQMKSKSDAMQGSCCYGTDQCSIFDKRSTLLQASDCDRIPAFNENHRKSRLKSHDLYILFSLLALIAKNAYDGLFNHYTTMAQKKYHTESLQSDAKDQFPRSTYHAVVDPLWQYSIALILGGAFACALYRLLESLTVTACFSNNEGSDQSCDINASVVIVSITALVFDLKSIKTIMTRVIFIQKPILVIVDLHPDYGILQVNQKEIPLTDLSAVRSRNAIFVWFLSLCYILAGLPMAIGSLALRSFNLHGMSELLYTTLGVLAVLREIFGVAFVAKLFLCIQWILVSSQKDREDFGRAVQREGLIQHFIIGACVAFVTVVPTFIARRIGIANPGVLVLLCCVLLGGLFGLIVGVMHGLPVHPDSYLTCWPATCYCITYYDRARCPCLFSCKSCGEINSRQILLVVTVTDVLAFNKMLKGVHPR